MIKIYKSFRMHGDYDYSVIGNSVVIRINDKIESFDLSSFPDGESGSVSDCLVLPYMPIQSIKRTGDDFEVYLFFDDWYKTRPQTFARKGITFEVAPTSDNNLDIAKEVRILVVADAFDNELKTGHFMSTILGIEVDCRRTENKNDKQNVEGLISNMSRKAKTVIDYIGYTEIKAGVTKEQLEALVAEMEDYVLALYKKKWTKQSQIQSATTIAQVKEVVW